MRPKPMDDPGHPAKGLPGYDKDEWAPKHVQAAKKRRRLKWELALAWLCVFGPLLTIKYCS